MNKKITTHIQRVTSFVYLKECFEESIDYFASSTKVEFDRIGFYDSTWHQELAPSYMLSDDEYNRVIRVWFPNSLTIDDEERFTEYCVTFNDDILYLSKQLDDVLGFLWSNLELLNKIVDDVHHTKILSDEQTREIIKNNNEIDNIIETLEEISELIRVDIFDMNWKNDEKEDEDKQDFALYSIWRSIDVLKKERK